MKFATDVSVFGNLNINNDLYTNNNVYFTGLNETSTNFILYIDTSSGDITYSSISQFNYDISTNYTLEGKGTPSNPLGIYDPSNYLKEIIMIPCSDENSDLLADTSVSTFTMPFDLWLLSLEANVKYPPSGSTLQVDINKNNTSILGTKLTIDSSEYSSSTAAVPVVISDSSLNNGDIITIDLDQVGSSNAGKGLKITLIGIRL